MGCMNEKIDLLLERTRGLISPYGDEKATNAQLSALAQVVQETLELLRESQAGG